MSNTGTANTEAAFTPHLWGATLLYALLVVNPTVWAESFPQSDFLTGRTTFITLAANDPWQDFKRIKQGQSPKRTEQGKDRDTGNPKSTFKKPVNRRNGAKVGPNPALIRASTDTSVGNASWLYFAGTMNIKSNAYYDPHDINFTWAYARREPLPNYPRIVVSMHGADVREDALEAFEPSTRGDIEIRTLDAGAYNNTWLEWWMFGRDGTPYPGRRIAAALQFLSTRYWIDMSVNGIVLEGEGMGGTGAVIQTMLLPSPWREYIAYSSARSGTGMPRKMAQHENTRFAKFPADNGTNSALWDSIDFEVQSANDPVVRGLHYRHAFSTDDPSGIEPGNANIQLQFINLIEQHKIAGAFAWVQSGASFFEQGVNLPDMSKFETTEQDVTLDRVHPAITDSTGNYPLLAVDRSNQTQFPRGHYNMGITWDHANTLDGREQIVLPLKYQRRINIGKNIPDQPEAITVSVTPRRAHSFRLQDGNLLKWSFNDSELTGTARVVGDTLTIEAIPLVSGEAYKSLRIYR
ncbi:MAG: hypothetical protein ACI9JM_000812 [Halioglobus sp.]|jgi:hypothetical protein